MYKLEKCVVTRHLLDKMRHNPYLTGITPHILIMADIEGLEYPLKDQKKIFFTMRDKLTRHSFGRYLYQL